eukprot:9285395-Alexandrium_andersonii.AAC.1
MRPLLVPTSPPCPLLLMRFGVCRCCFCRSIPLARRLPAFGVGLLGPSMPIVGFPCPAPLARRRGEVSALGGP